MAKIRKLKLSWNDSDSDTVTGYRLYWSEGTNIGYDSEFIDVGNATEIDLPDDVALPDRPILFGVTAIDKNGNESDMTTLAEPYLLHAPKAPGSLSLIHSKEFRVMESREATESASEGLDDDPLADAIESHESKKPVKLKYYDDVGYRKFRSE
ncbi:hypothetical protein DSCW_46290 [Desulfosarcina widdelii]|uniref:Fibronectin type-III domain-containing protein n=1 Tax=Desulfosarcina widdelii TaxID=947919 RepID=A0A5K7Z5D4_9BACT|nr:hypothetical protein [Desulfosarcina widdelii]BBO77212.1 hypothetical protein DSCW_46290 [Desulfosarcina widdelii]